MPAVFAGHLTEPAFCYEDAFEATVCLWRQTGDDRWHHGDLELPDHPDPDGANWLFQALLDPTPATWTATAQAYYGRKLDPAVVAEVWARFAWPSVAALPGGYAGFVAFRVCEDPEGRGSRR